MNEIQPLYLTTYNFNQEAYAKFVSEGNVESQLDEYNNLILSGDADEQNIIDVNRYLIKVAPLKSMMLAPQIENFFDTNVTEFTDVEDDEDLAMSDSEVITEFAQDAVSELDDQLAQEQIMQHQINELSDTLEVEIEKGVRFKEGAVQTYTASRDLIVSQRIQLGQGKSPADFSDKFPFLPKSEEDESEIDKFPFMGSP